MYAKALRNYEGADESFLNLRKGDVIKILDRNHDDWFSGELNGKIGM